MAGLFGWTRLIAIQWIYRPRVKRNLKFGDTKEASSLITVSMKYKNHFHFPEFGENEFVPQLCYAEMNFKWKALHF